MLDSSQSGVDGVGQPKIITNSFAVRLKAKDIKVEKETYLVVTGEQSAATFTIPIIVRPGKRVFFDPPWEVYVPPLPEASFRFVIIPPPPRVYPPVASFWIAPI
jgi:aspartate/methionine/tyrosine aminotransferase